MERIEKLLVLLTVSFCWCHKTGEYKNEEKPIKVLKHGRKSYSLFRYGLDVLREMIFNTLKATPKKIKFLIKLLDIGEIPCAYS